MASTTEPTKICPYSIPDLKNTTDDAVGAYLTTKSFTQSHLLTDVRLALSLLACLTAAATFYLDYTLGFDKTKSFTLYACIAYFLINTVLTIWLYFVESSTIYVGSHDPSGVKLKIESRAGKYEPRYFLRIEQTESVEGRTVVRVKDVEGAFMGWVDEKGFFVRREFEKWLGGVVPWIAEGEGVRKEGKGEKEGVRLVSGVEDVGSGKGSVRRKGKKT
ncbi:hypothetical protein ABW19_dt0202598 [Dactylella cylindrospora]|nr:hypothetical protein ABW19_dt0202598 [Dactylella cylindrospora]